LDASTRRSDVSELQGAALREREPAGSKRLARLMAIAFVIALSTGLLTRAAVADHYHTNCVGHGFVHGTSTSDGSFHSRVEPGCGNGLKTCTLYTSGSYRGGEGTYDPSSCSFWVGSGSECASEAHVDYDGVFSSHVHYAHNWCG
jgi:hypothetical protein